MIEKAIEKLLFASRWILAPVYLGMSLALVALGVKFFMQTAHVIRCIVPIGEADLVLELLALIDLVLVGSLIVMVMFSGYENFVSRIDVKAGGDSLGWLGKLDASSLKLKVAASIVAISSIHLLSAFMRLAGDHSTKSPDLACQPKNLEPLTTEQLKWYVIIHLTFVVSAVMMGVLDRISFAAHRDHKD